MRERGQASVETIALIAVALAVAAALLLGVARFGPPFTTMLVQALSGVIAPASERAPGLDGLEAALLAGATGPDADGPTLLDVRTHLRTRLGRAAGDVAFDRVLRPLVERALPSGAKIEDVEGVGIVGAATEKAWLRTRFHHDFMTQAAELAVSSAGQIGASYSVLKSFGVVEGDLPDSIAPGERMGDVLVLLPLQRRIVLRHKIDDGLTVLEDRYAMRQAYRP